MRIVTFSDADRPRAGIVLGERILDLHAAFRSVFGRDGPDSVLDVIDGGESMAQEISTLIGRVGSSRDDTGLFRDLGSTRLQAPIPVPRKNVFCVGRNYKLHIEEGARARGTAPSYPPVPEFFTKPPTSVVGPDAEIELDTTVTGKLDYEVELAFIIGRTCKDVPAARAADFIFGYTVLNDVTARDLQAAHGQWFKGKGLDTFCPIGPMIVTADEFGSWRGHRLQLRVNGETRQDSVTDDMLFDCAAILASLSAGLTLEPGDLVTTGTPSGVGLGMSPQAWLKHGDVIEAEIDGIGVLRNSVRQVR